MKNSVLLPKTQMDMFDFINEADILPVAPVVPLSRITGAGRESAIVYTLPNLPDGSYDEAGNAGMVAFYHACMTAGYRDRLTTMGSLDAKKACRAANAMLGRPASDRPQPTVEEWSSAAKAVVAASENGFAEIGSLEALVADLSKGVGA